MEVSQKKILITGGLGNLGSWLTEYFCRQGYDVTVLTKRLRNLAFDLPYKTIVCDISSQTDCLEKITEKYNSIIHCASINEHHDDSYPKDALLVNSLGTRNILEALKSNKPEHFIYFSTFHVYGKNSGEITEKTDTVPLNDYGITHLFAEYYVKQYHAKFGIPYSIIRLSNSYGCPKDYNSSKWYLILNDLSKMAFEDKKIVLKGNGLASRDFIWMGDVCKVVESLPVNNDTFNLSGEKSYSLLDVAEAVQTAYQNQFGEYIEIELNKSDPYKPGEPMFINASKIKGLVNYKAEPHFVQEAENIFNFLKARKK